MRTRTWPQQWPVLGVCWAAASLLQASQCAHGWTLVWCRCVPATRAASLACPDPWGPASPAPPAIWAGPTCGPGQPWRWQLQPSAARAPCWPSAPCRQRASSWPLPRRPPTHSQQHPAAMASAIQTQSSGGPAGQPSHRAPAAGAPQNGHSSGASSGQASPPAPASPASESGLESHKRPAEAAPRLRAEGHQCAPAALSTWQPPARRTQLLQQRRLAVSDPSTVARALAEHMRKRNKRLQQDPALAAEMEVQLGLAMAARAGDAAEALSIYDAARNRGAPWALRCCCQAAAVQQTCAPPASIAFRHQRLSLSRLPSPDSTLLGLPTEPPAAAGIRVKLPSLQSLLYLCSGGRRLAPGGCRARPAACGARERAGGRQPIRRPSQRRWSTLRWRPPAQTVLCRPSSRRQQQQQRMSSVERQLLRQRYRLASSRRPPAQPGSTACTSVWFPGARHPRRRALPLCAALQQACGCDENDSSLKLIHMRSKRPQFAEPPGLGTHQPCTLQSATLLRSPCLQAMPLPERFAAAQGIIAELRSSGQQPTGGLALVEAAGRACAQHSCSLSASQPDMQCISIPASTATPAAGQGSASLPGLPAP